MGGKKEHRNLDQDKSDVSVGQREEASKNNKKILEEKLLSFLN